MNIQRKPQRRLAAAGLMLGVVATLGLAACGGGGSSSATETVAASSESTSQALASRRTSTPSPAATLVAQPPSTEGRLLASNCFQCHGTLGTGGFENIRGGEAREVLEYMTQNASRDIMAAHAQGYTPEQLQKIIAYLQQ